MNPEAVLATVTLPLAGAVSLTVEHAWVGVGFLGQFLFSCRFLIQWLYSERHKRSLIPVAFWYFSIGGGLVLLAYALWRRDPVFIAGQALGLVIYLRNLALIRKGTLRDAAEEAAEAAGQAGPPKGAGTA